MFFSERYGYNKIDESLNYQNISPALKNRIWNLFYDIYSNFEYKISLNFLEFVWEKFFKLRIDELNIASSYSALMDIKKKFFNLNWYEVYDFVEFVYNETDVKKMWEIGVNKILEEERAPYRLIKGHIAPLTNKEEINEIEKALEENDKLIQAKKHIEKALILFSDRTNPDYENSIKEAISAIETLSKKILKDEKGTLGELIKKTDLHPALKDGINKIYGWTSDEGGLRHGNKPEQKNKYLENESRFMLIFCSALFNYLVSKYGKEIC
ncbi:MAG: AbiJ-NTD4 domain-containing protein [Elusimicrobiota bacterium]